MGNKMNKSYFIISLVIMGMITSIFFWYYVPKQQITLFTVTLSSSLSFIIIYGLAVFLGIIDSINYERNIFSVIMIWIIPTILYIFLYYWKNEKKILLFTSVIFVISCLSILRMCKALGKTLNDNDHYLYWKKRSKYIIIRLVLCFTLGAAASAGYFFQSKYEAAPQVQATYIPIPSYDEWIKHDPEQLLSNNMDSIVLFNNWKELDSTSKKQAFIALLKVECRYLGMNTLPHVIVTDLPANITGRYEYDSDTIYIQKSLYDSINEDSGSSIIYLVCFTTYCRYVYWQQDMYQQLYSDSNYEKYKYLLCFSDIVRYIDEQSTITPTVSPDSPDNSYHKRIEFDADSYSKTSEEHYLSYIDTYLKNGHL